MNETRETRGQPPLTIHQFDDKFVNNRRYFVEATSRLVTYLRTRFRNFLCTQFSVCNLVFVGLVARNCGHKAPSLASATYDNVV